MLRNSRTVSTANGKPTKSITNGNTESCANGQFRAEIEIQLDIYLKLLNRISIIL